MNKKIASGVGAFLVISTSLNLPSVIAVDSSYSMNINVDLSGEKKEISPYIYGVNEMANLDEVTTTAVRQGGNRYTAYNWETNYSNAGSDWYNSSDTHLSTSTTPGACAIKLSEESQDHNVDYKFTTLQMAGYVSADKNGEVTETAPSERWNRVEFRKGTELSLKPDLDDGIVYMDEYVNYIVQTLGDATTSTGMQGYSLDNEPALWSETHSLIQQSPVGMKELVDKSKQLATVVKDIDPNAEVFGPALWGYLSYKQLADNEDSNEWETIKAEGDYNWFTDYYLDEMKKASDEYGSRLIDCLDVHYYAQAKDTTEDILQGVRTLYDESYIENSWIGEMKQWFPNDLPILPNLKSSIDKYYPGTKLTISEYDFYGGNDIIGAIVEAEALGCFADNNIYLATYWGSDAPYTFAGINLYTNYDGQGSSFGDTLVETSMEGADASISNAYASIESTDDGQVNVVVTNKTNQVGKATINIDNSSSTYDNAIVYGIVEGSSDIILLDTIENVQDNTVEVELPAMCVAHVVVSDDPNAIENLPEITTTEAPTYETVTYNASDITDESGNLYIDNVENIQDIAKIVIDTDVSSEKGSSWYTLGGAVCLTVDTDASKDVWAFKDFMLKNNAKSVEVIVDGSFKNGDGEDITGTISGNSLEIQSWWFASELDTNGDGKEDMVNPNFKTVTIYYNTKTTTETTNTQTEVTTSINTNIPTETTTSNQEVDTLVGDINCDGSVKSNDLLMLKKYLLGLITLEEGSQGYINSDINQDGKTMTNDLLMLKKTLLGINSL